MNQVVVVGSDHYNTLGVVRSLGESGIKPNVIVYSDHPERSFVLKSKYIQSGFALKDCNEELIEKLISQYEDKAIPAIIIGTSDLACLTIDAHLDKLKHFICANCHHTPNGLWKWMDKHKVNECARTCDLAVPNSIFVPKGQNIPADSIRFPCIVKPLESAFGNKRDITICFNQEELKSAYAIFQELKIDVLIQDYVEAEYEVGIMGCSFYHTDEIWIPDVIYKHRFSNKSAVFAEIQSSDLAIELKNTIENVKSLIASIGYKGIFDVDLLYASGTFYFIEVNLRNGAYGYGLTKAGTNLAAAWCLEAAKEPYDLGRIEKPSYLMCEFSDLKCRRENGVSFTQWIKDYLRSAHMILQRKDPAPAIAYIKDKL